MLEIKENDENEGLDDEDTVMKTKIVIGGRLPKKEVKKVAKVGLKKDGKSALRAKETNRA